MSDTLKVEYNGTVFRLNGRLVSLSGFSYIPIEAKSDEISKDVSVFITIDQSSKNMET